jgi:hypothetical protein
MGGNGLAGDMLSGGNGGDGSAGDVLSGGDGLLARMGPNPGGTLGVGTAGARGAGDGAGSTLGVGVAGVGSACSGGTFGAGATGAGSAGGVGAGRQFVRTSARVWRVFVSPFVSGARSELTEGFCRAWTMSLVPAITRSIYEARGMVTCIPSTSNLS